MMEKIVDAKTGLITEVEGQEIIETIPQEPTTEEVLNDLIATLVTKGVIY